MSKYFSKAKEKRNNEKIEINSENLNNKTISKNLLYGIIKPRYEEIFEIIRDHIFDDIYARVSIKSIVITGGASKIYGLKDISESIFNRRVRIGSNSNRESFFHNKPEFSTILGLIKLAHENNEFNNFNELTKNNFFTAFDKLENWIEESYAWVLKQIVTFCDLKICYNFVKNKICYMQVINLKAKRKVLQLA